MRIFDNLEVAIVEGNKVFRCFKCGYVLGPATENYKNYALKHDKPISEGQPHYLVPQKEVPFVLREYCCPDCAIMFEVDMVLKDEKPLRSVILKE